VAPLRTWRDRIRDPSLTALLMLELCAMFLAAPLAAKGLPIARVVADSMLLAVLLVVVSVSDRWGAILLILLGLAATAASLIIGAPASPATVAVLRRGGDILMFAALIWVVGEIVYAPGRITPRRLQGAVALYLGVATLFASVFGLIWELSPDAFTHLGTPVRGPEEAAAMLYFSLTTLATVGYGDIVAVDPFARSLANLEAIAGQFFLAITVARLVTLELAERRSIPSSNGGRAPRRHL
jgi:hypothetical protein